MKIKYFIVVSCLLILSIINCSDKSNPTMPQDINNNSIGTISLNLPGTIVNTPTVLAVSVDINPEITLSDSVLKLVLIDESDNIIEELTSLHDDGKTSHNDDIAGDNKFNQLFDVVENTEKKIRLRCYANYIMNGEIVEGRSDIAEFTIYNDLTASDLSEMHNTQRNSIKKIQEFFDSNGGNREEAFQQLIIWLDNLSHVDSVKSDGLGTIGLKYKSGLMGSIIFSEVDENGKVTTRGGIIDSSSSRNIKTPFKYQTTGKSLKYPMNNIRQTLNKSIIDPELIGNRKALIYAPFQAQFSMDHGPSITKILNDSDLDFEVTLLENSSADISALNNITDYGLILISSHGANIPRPMFATGEIADTNINKISPFHQTLLRAGQLSLMTLSQENLLGWEVNKHDYWAITPLYFFYHTLSKKFPNSVVILSACWCSLSNDFSKSLLQNGAKAFFGYNGVVDNSFTVPVVDVLVNSLTNELKTIGQSFIPNQSDPTNSLTKFEMVTKTNGLHYPLELINGDFEFGVLDGWNKSGDGRIITKLGNLSPSEGSFMGIISTGLGQTVATGSLTQTIKVEENQKLTLKWNFLSEEFLEFIGSSFQDFFQVAIKTKDGVNNLILVKTIDDIANEFGATKTPENAGNLISVTPPIDFGNHGVYMTDWQTFTFDLTAYEDQIVTLVLAVGDVGDSAFDTAVLLDSITIE